MGNMFDQASQNLARATQPLQRWPLLYRSVLLVTGLAVYAAGIAVVDAVTGDARPPVILFAMFFLPAVLRAVVQWYWQVKSDLRKLRTRLSDQKHRHKPA